MFAKTKTIFREVNQTAIQFYLEHLKTTESNFCKITEILTCLVGLSKFYLETLNFTPRTQLVLSICYSKFLPTQQHLLSHFSQIRGP